jgi:iron(III) transport system ATP-binding protein
MPAIALRQVTKRFAGAPPAVFELDLTIPDASFTTLLGPSGCGKTTTLRMIAGLEMPSEGEIDIGEQNVFSLSRGRSVAPAKRGLGLVFQSYALWPHLTVRQNIAFGLEVQKTGRAETMRRVQEVAEALQIDPYVARYTSELSGGQQQRVAIARVLVMRPQVLLLDEPLSNLDAKLRMDMRAELKRLHAESGATVVYVTHDQLEALTMSTHIALMRDGVLQQFAPPLELYAHPANRFAADFLGNPRINLLAGTVEAGAIHCGALWVPLSHGGVGGGAGAGASAGVEGTGARVEGRGGLEAPPGLLDARPGEPLTVGLRAEELRLEREAAAGRAAVRVLSVLPTGADWYYRVGFGDEIVTVRDDRHPDLREGDEAWLVAAPNPLKAFDAEGRSRTAPGDRDASPPGAVATAGVREAGASPPPAVAGKAARP